MGDSELGWNDFSLPGCGECFDNEDGSSRQDELRRCRTGEEAHLVREPDNPHDPLAVAIVSARGVRVGYLRRQYAQWIAPKIDDGRAFPAAIVERVKGIDLPGSSSEERRVGKEGVSKFRYRGARYHSKNK